MSSHRPLAAAPRPRATTLEGDGCNNPPTSGAGARACPGLVDPGLVDPGLVDPGRRDAPGALHGRSDAPHEPTVRRGPGYDPQPSRRGGPRPGDVPQGLPEVPPVQARHQHQSLAVSNPDEHLHHRVPQGTAFAQARIQRHRRGLAARRRGLPRGGRTQVRRGRSPRGAALHAAARGPRFALRGTPDGCPHG